MGNRIVENDTTPNNSIGGGASGLKDRDYFLPFLVNITTPKNTTRESYLSTILNLPNGRINKIWIEFPRGCSGLTGIQIFRGPEQIFPIPKLQWFIGDGFLINLQFTQIIDTNPFELEFRTYNVDDTYQHRISVVLEMSGSKSEITSRLTNLLNMAGA